VTGLQHGGRRVGSPYPTLPYTYPTPKGLPARATQALYVTMFPCCECAKLLIQAGIREVVYFEDKASPARPASASLSGIRCCIPCPSPYPTYPYPQGQRGAWAAGASLSGGRQQVPRWAPRRRPAQLGPPPCACASCSRSCRAPQHSPLDALFPPRPVSEVLIKNVVQQS